MSQAGVRQPTPAGDAKLARMRAILLAAAILLLSVPAAPQNQKGKKPPDVVVIEAKARRSEGKILVDGNVRIMSPKPLRGLVMIFDLMSAEKGVLASEQAVVAEEHLEAGQERTCHAETADLGRAVQFKVRFFDTAERELRGENLGPFPID